MGGKTNGLIWSKYERCGKYIVISPNKVVIFSAILESILIWPKYLPEVMFPAAYVCLFAK